MANKEITSEVCHESETKLQNIVNRQLDLKKAMQEGAVNEKKWLEDHTFEVEGQLEEFHSQALTLY